ncbi:antitermination protein [Klebsiella michiganensis]|uniref:antitermination protein n=1 Tax=Klebsiella michiganensis TaxID=1134687 RepID=UPI001CC9E196|nr:antitermination protein [Klebsiella michiganensis]MBZ7580712.1 antitermination protein [Klebsiella michiganensis]
MSRKTAFNGSAAGRRRAQRSHLQNPQTLSSDLIHRPTPSRAQIQAKGKHHTPERIGDALPIKFVALDIFWQREEYKRQIERATIIYQQEFAHQYAQPGTWLFQRAIYALGLQKRKKITAR